MSWIDKEVFLMQTHLTPANPESLFFAGIRQAKLHPCSPEFSAVLKAINSWQLFFPFLFEVIRQRSITESCVFKAARSLSVQCRYHIALQSVGWLQKLSCCYSSHWGTSQLLQDCDGGYCHPGKALIRWRGKLQPFTMNFRRREVWLDPDQSVWWYVAAQKELAELSK